MFKTNEDIKFEELSDDQLSKVAGGEVDGNTINLLVGRIQNIIDLLNNHPLFSKIESCIEAKEHLIDTKDDVAQLRLENAFYSVGKAMEVVKAGIVSEPDYADALLDIENKIGSIRSSIAYLAD